MAQARSRPEADQFPELEEIDPDAAVIEVIRDAISLRRQVLANCPGEEGEKYHEFCPHVLGMKGRSYRVLAYQFADDTAPGWKCFKLCALTNVSSRSAPGTRTTMILTRIIRNASTRSCNASGDQDMSCTAESGFAAASAWPA